MEANNGGEELILEPAHPGVMEAHSGLVEAHPGAMEAHPADMEPPHRGTLEAHPWSHGDLPLGHGGPSWSQG